MSGDQRCGSAFPSKMLYATPFILVALLGLVVALAVPRWRRPALPALVAPLAFGFCALVGWLGSLIISRSLFKVELGSLGTSISYVLPGLLGAWLAVLLVNLMFREVRAESMNDIYDLDAAHKHCIRHRPEMEASELCGCFNCLST